MVLPRPLSPLLPPSLNCVLQERLSADDLGVFHKVVLSVSYCIVFSPEANAHAALQTCLKCLECGTVLSLGKFASLGGKVGSPGSCGGTVFHELGLLARSLFMLHRLCACFALKVARAGVLQAALQTVVQGQGQLQRRLRRGAAQEQVAEGRRNRRGGRRRCFRACGQGRVVQPGAATLLVVARLLSAI